MKNLKELSLNISEEEYRELPYISYSLLSRYRQLGFEELSHLNDKVSSPSLTFGSAVDTYLTDGINAFNNRFAIVSLPNPVSDTMKQLCEFIYSQNPTDNLTSIPEANLLNYMDICSYRLKNKAVTRLKYLFDYGEAYFNSLSKSQGKEILTAEDYQDVVNAVETLRSHENTILYFSNREKEDIESCYQLKFIGRYNDINFKCMADLILVDHKNKTIQLCDLKTTKSVISFNDSFYKWNYFYQASLYTEAVRQTIANDDYFKDFEILPTYKFITIDRKIFYPIVFSVPTKISDIPLIGPDYQKIPSWKETLEELNYYLTYNCILPKEMTEEIKETKEIKIKTY